MIEEIRKACGIAPVEEEGPVETDEPAADIQAGEALLEELDDETDLARDAFDVDVGAAGAS